MDLAEMVTESARRVLPLARSKGLVSYFDYRGPFVELQADELRMQAALHRVLVGMIDLIGSGFVMFTADVSFSAGRAALTISAAGTGQFAAPAQVSAVLARLQLGLIDEPAGAGERHAFGRCPATGAELGFVDVPGESMVISWRAELPGLLLEDEQAGSLPQSAGSRAWLVSATEGGLDSVDLRLRRHGWRTAAFVDLARVLARLQATPSGRPQLLLVAESTPQDLALLERLAANYPGLWVVLGVEAGSPALVARGNSAVDVRVLPLSPADLLGFTRHVDPRSSTAESRLTAPAPLYRATRRSILVVDDNPVNQMVAAGLLDVLGFDVETADNGEEALLRCSVRPPALVLMDIHMPVMDGLEASRRLRALQSSGDVPPFPIIAATADLEAESRDRCTQAGMDGYLQKPLDIHLLKSTMQRSLPASPVHEGYTVY